jgi:hypothetical protein
MIQMFIFITFWLTDDFFHTYYTKPIYSQTFSGHSSNALIIKLLKEYKRKRFKLFNNNVFFIDVFIQWLIYCGKIFLSSDWKSSFKS